MTTKIALTITPNVEVLDPERIDAAMMRTIETLRRLGIVPLRKLTLNIECKDEDADGLEDTIDAALSARPVGIEVVMEKKSKRHVSRDTLAPVTPAVVSADLQSGFDRVSFAQSGALALPGLAHFTFGFLGMLMAPEVCGAPFRVLPFFYTNARLASRRQSIASIAIDVKHGARLPCPASMAPLQTGLDFRHILIQSQAQPTGGDFQYA